MNDELNPGVRKIKVAVLSWLEGVCHAPGLYRYSESAHHPYAAESSAMAVHTLWELGELTNMSTERMTQHVDALQSFQDEDGVFRDPLVTEKDRIDKNHPWTKVYEHISGVCEQALAVLGTSSLRPNQTSLIFDLTKLDPDEWISSLDHREVPWGRCHNVAFSLLGYRRRLGLLNMTDKKATRVYQLIENEMLHPEDGMPGAIDHPIGQRIAGYYMLIFCYLPFKRALPNPEAAIDLILKALTPEGEIDEGGMCQNWDAICVLNQVCSQLDWSYCHDDVCDLADRIKGFLMTTHRKPDGGFSFNPNLCMQEHSHIKIAPAVNESDIMGTMMALASLNIIGSIRKKKKHETFMEPWFRMIRQPKAVCDRMHTH